MTTLYKINGQFITWDAAHNIHGYTTTATEVVVSGYECVSPWGDDSGMGGYLDRHSSDNIFEWEFWIDDEETWRGIDAIATEFGLYPASCIDTELTNGTSVSPAVYFENLDEVWYLIRDAVGLGWIEENDLENNGWYHVDDTSYEFILFDATTGKVSYGVETLSEMEFVEAGAFTISDGGEVVFVEQSPFPVVCTYAIEFSPTETVADGDSVDTDLPYYASKLYLPIAVLDSGASVEEYYGWNVSEEQPAPALPTVTVLDNIGLSSVTSISSGVYTNPLSKWNGSSYTGVKITYNSDKAYGAIEYASGSGGWSSPVGIFEPASVVNPGTGNNVIGAKNVSSSSQNFFAIRVASCSDSTATVITVYNSSNNAYNAFKFTAGGTYYYYVLDGTQTEWTDDLSTVGYEEYSPEPPVVLPTVSTDNWCDGYNAMGDLSPQQQIYAYISNTNNKIPYDDSVSYGVVDWYSISPFGVLQGHAEVSLVKETDIYQNSYVSIRNVSSSTINFGWAEYAVCSSNQATVVTVYDSSNTAYNAFKFTAGGTDYYYVLDGTQTEWTDDLAGIGYRLPYFGYIQSDKSSIAVVGRSYYNMYDDLGNNIQYETGKTYTYVGCLDAQGNQVNIPTGYIAQSTSGMVWSPATSSPGGTSVQKVLYLVS